MAVYVTFAYLIGFIGFGTATVLAYLFYRDFFASESPPAEWKILYTGLVSLALSMLFRSLSEPFNARWMPDASSVLLLLGAALLMTSGFTLWYKFRL